MTQQASVRKRHSALGCESEIFVIVICFYLFDSMINEANGSSSTCELGLEFQVETSTPPNEIKIRRLAGNASGSYFKNAMVQGYLYGSPLLARMAATIMKMSHTMTNPAEKGTPMHAKMSNAATMRLIE